MPNNFFKIIFKWVAGLMALSFLSNWVLFYLLTNSSLITNEYYSNGGLVSIVYPLIFFLCFSSMLGFGLRDLARSNKYEISVWTVFIFTVCFIIFPTILNFGTMYYRSFSNEGIAKMIENGSYLSSILFSILSKIIYALIIITLASQWRIFRKAGKKGWFALIPFYNIVIMCDIIKRPRGWVLLFFIPLVNLIGIATITNGMARVFNRSDSFSIGLFFLPFIFFPILAFGKNEYIHGEYKIVNDDLNLEDHLIQ